MYAIRSYYELVPDGARRARGDAFAAQGASALGRTAFPVYRIFVDGEKGTGLRAFHAPDARIRVYRDPKAGNGTEKGLKGPEGAQGTALHALFGEKGKHDNETEKKSDEQHRGDEGLSVGDFREFGNQLKGAKPFAVHGRHKSEGYQDDKAEKRVMRRPDIAVPGKGLYAPFFKHPRGALFPSPVEANPAAPSPADGDGGDEPN